MAHEVFLSDRTRAAIQHRLGGVPATDVPTYRRVARLFDVLRLDELPDDAQARLGQPGPQFANGEARFVLTSAHRDDLIQWLEPTDRAPLTAFMGRLLMPVYDRLKESRDGKSVADESTEEATSAGKDT